MDSLTKESQAACGVRNYVSCAGSMGRISCLAPSATVMGLGIELVEVLTYILVLVPTS